MEMDERASFIGLAGVMAMACRHRRPDATRETSSGDRTSDQLATRERWAGPREVAERFAVSRLSWKWRTRSSVKIAERTYEKRAQALHC